jgi:membrane protease YdiL (CAAX protease family)
VYHSSVLPEPSVASPEQPPVGREVLTRTRAAAEVLICSGYPTQLLIVAALAALGVRSGSAGELSPSFVFALSAVDTVLLLGLVWLFLKRSGDRPRDLFLGSRDVSSELGVGVLLVPLVFTIVVVVQIAIRVVAPSLHDVDVSPFTPLLSSPWRLAGFIVLVLVAGGVREELQRAFLLHRFEQRLGGGGVGLVVTSAAFGLGHTLQGSDAAIITALLGAFWGAMYLARRSAVATVTNHALFNVAQIALGYATLVQT